MSAAYGMSFMVLAELKNLEKRSNYATSTTTHTHVTSEIEMVTLPDLSDETNQSGEKLVRKAGLLITCPDFKKVVLGSE